MDSQAVQALSNPLGPALGPAKDQATAGLFIEQILQHFRLAVFGHFECLEPHILRDRKSTRLNSSHVSISYAVFCLKKKNSVTADPHVYRIYTFITPARVRHYRLLRYRLSS